MGDGVGDGVSENWRKAGWAGAAIGVIAAGAAAGVAMERLTVGRGMRMKARLALDAAGDYGSLRGTEGTTRAEDATEIYYETDELPEEKGSRGRLLRRKAAAAPTVVFCHGYCLSQDSWHFQRAALRGVVRSVYWDQRSHGRSARGLAQADGEPVTIEQLGRDLKAVIDAAAPEGPLVLVGHSMGGMTIMALAEQFPGLVGERVLGVALIGTSSGGLGEVTYGLPLPAAGLSAVRRVLPGVLRALGSQVELVEKGRRATADLFAGMVKRYSFGSREVDPAVARFAERLIETTPIDVVAEFYPAFQIHDKSAALQRFADIPVTVIAGDRDMITPAAHSEAIKAELPAAELTVLESAGHLMMLEYPETVTGLLGDLLVRTGAVAAATNVGGHGRSTAGSTAGTAGSTPQPGH
ncbi:alpha/beta hydrolase [Streptomyces goshikiensis]|uniref:Alpha/beta hydrolase n=1 Tax=Streptomyces goshikiensis TaxID=1942 RepID=A0ABZ1RJM2_9ACTN|nr:MULTISPECIES: alpha/beta hydrolase [Streptomyces]AKL67451.1 lipase [Streptomyces sp. Mg1]EDX22996.1 lipase [Streptomyces sp. Mg1]RPK46954.1 3-oxoadipate enol-lactonase 2 [Streptomyces sp. ADI91-18]WBY21633.1 alpha/beta hydrolase [Streptomyces goshikiensis]WSS00401.1 alpha/beta hydrolase [Streptomyces goshikiensis]